ncbi:MAG: hypothetical protein Q8L69_17515 [Gallionellaceae bacterium]|nr:hypothetical protein [Gallionellaceae bacterium]
MQRIFRMLQEAHCRAVSGIQKNAVSTLRLQAICQQPGKLLFAFDLFVGGLFGISDHIDKQNRRTGETRRFFAK